MSNLKKTVFILITFLSIFFSSIGYARCNLDLSRWQYVTNTTSNYQVYCDMQSLSRYEDGLKAWVCYYKPDVNPKKERYNMVYYGILYSTRSFCRYSDSTSDGNGKTIDSTLPYMLNLIGWRPISPNSIVEIIMNKYRR